MDIFFEVHCDLPREGPGDNASTRKAYSLLTGLPPKPRILDIGCGPGMQTVELAKISGGTLVAVDTHTPFLDALRGSAAAEGVTEHIDIQQASMFDLQFPEHSFDLLWCEGAIYIIGFGEGLRTWRRLLKEDGCVAVTELSWIKTNPPSEIVTYWKENYPAIRTIAENLQTAADAGYLVIDHFILPDSSWWDNYYHPMEKRIAMLREKFRGDEAVQKDLDGHQEEVEMFRKYSEWYGYVFYVLKVK
jgi:ubiquinone/menaquinone biosynthesis C-methylase UbiE